MISRKIEYFVTLAECLSFTQTAMHYNVSQTAISQYIASLEERLGIRLFERTQRSVVLTYAGEFYYQRVKAILHQYDQTLDDLKVISEGYHGSLKVGVGMYEYCSTESFIASFLNSFPDVRVDILQYPYSELTEKLKKGELDIIIADSLVMHAFSQKEICSRTLFESPNYIVASIETAERYRGRDVAEILRQECLITNCETNGPSSLDMLRKLLIDEFGFVPEKISQTNSVNAQLMMVRANRGVAMVPGFIAETQGNEFSRFPLPSNQKICYNLVKMCESMNDAAEAMMSYRV